MNLNPKILAALFLLGGLCVIIGIVFVYHGTSKRVDEVLIISNQRPQKTPNRTRSTVTIPRTTINSFKCHKAGMKQWSVRVEACAKQIAAPINGIITNWQLANNPSNRNQFKLHANGSFEIKEKGFYNISIKVSFSCSRREKYSINIVAAPNIRNAFNTSAKAKGNQCVVKSTFCGNITEKVLFSIRVSKSALVLLYPEHTSFTVTKWKQNVFSKLFVTSS